MEISPLTAPEIVSLLVSLAALAGTLLTARLAARRLRSQNNLDDANASDAISRAATGIVSELRKTIGELQAKAIEAADKIEALEAGVVALRLERDRLNLRIASTEHEIEKFRRGVGLLVAQIRSLGHAPVWEPEKSPPATPPAIP